MLFETDYDSAFDGETVFVQGYWDLSKRTRKKLLNHLNFTEKERPIIPATWMLTTFAPAPLVAVHPAWLMLSGIVFVSSLMAWGFNLGETTETKRPKLPKVAVIPVRNDARWNALGHAFENNEWRRVKRELSTDTELCRTLSGIVCPYMDKTEHLLALRKEAAELNANEQIRSLDERLRAAAASVKHAIAKELERHDNLEQEEEAKANAEAEEIRQGKLRVLDSNIQIALDNTAEYEVLAERAKLEE